MNSPAAQRPGPIQPCFEARELQAGYGRIKVLKDISFSIQAGERVCVIGPNGCGKTTLLRVLAGNLAYTGSLKIRITDPVSRRAGSFCERNDLTALEGARETALLSQLPYSHFDYTVRETVETGRYSRMMRRFPRIQTATDTEAIEKALEDAGIPDLAERRLATLSGGQLQRVFLARTLAQNSPVLLLDEPTNHLDLRYQTELTTLLRDWTQQNEYRCAVAVFHDLTLALEFGTRFILMDNGRVLLDCPAADLAGSDALNGLYGMDVKKRMQDLYTRWTDS